MGLGRLCPFQSRGLAEERVLKGRYQRCRQRFGGTLEDKVVGVDKDCKVNGRYPWAFIVTDNPIGFQLD